MPEEDMVCGLVVRLGLWLMVEVGWVCGWSEETRVITMEEGS